MITTDIKPPFEEVTMDKLVNLFSIIFKQIDDDNDSDNEPISYKIQENSEKVKQSSEHDPSIGVKASIPESPEANSYDVVS